MMIMIIKRKKTNDAKCNYSPPADRCQTPPPPFLNPNWPPFWVTPCNLYTGHDVLRFGISLWSL